MNWDFVKYHCTQRVGFITLNRAEKRNALNVKFVNELKEAFTNAETDSNCKIIVLQAEGDVFSAGADLEHLKKLQSNSYEENLADSTNLMELFQQIYNLSKVVIASIQGHAIAGGCGLATVCDLSISNIEAKFGYSEVKIGFIPAIVSVFLIRKIGEAKSKELLLTGNIISAEKAKKYGLINKVVEKEQLTNSVLELAQQLCNTTSEESLKITKKLIHNIQDKETEDAFQWAAELNAKTREMKDCKKGISAFLNKKKINW